MNSTDIIDFLIKIENRKKNLIKKVANYSKRNIYFDIENEIKEFKDKKNNRIYLFYGLRGIGKSTAIYQILENYPEILFLEGNELKNKQMDLLEVIENYKQINKNKIIIIDEITEIENWAEKIKLLMDLEDLKIIATGSSAIKLLNKNAKILRRTYFKKIIPLSFKEYLRLKNKLEIDINKEIIEILSSNPKDAYIKSIPTYQKVKKIAPEIKKYFKEYLKDGFPLCLNNFLAIDDISKQLINLVAINDFSEINSFNLETINKSNEIVYYIADNKAGESSLQNISNFSKLNQTTINKIIDAFKIADLFITIYNDSQSATKLRKEPKILFSNPAIRYGFIKDISENYIGSLREDAFVTHMHYNDIKLNYLKHNKKSPDYKLTFKNIQTIVEIGGPSKKTNQLQKGFIFTDDDRIDIIENICYLPLYLICLI
jgi:uncharacterized protein